MPRTGPNAQYEDAELRYMRLWHRARALGFDLRIVLFPDPIEEIPGYILVETPPADLQAGLDVAEVTIRGGEFALENENRRNEKELDDFINAIATQVKEETPE